MGRHSRPKESRNKVLDLEKKGCGRNKSFVDKKATTVQWEKVKVFSTRGARTTGYVQE